MFVSPAGNAESAVPKSMNRLSGNEDDYRVDRIGSGPFIGRHVSSQANPIRAGNQVEGTEGRDIPRLAVGSSRVGSPACDRGLSPQRRCKEM